MTLVVDASVALKWFLGEGGEPDTHAALRLLEHTDAVLVTADRRYFAEARGRGSIVEIGDWRPD